MGKILAYLCTSTDKQDLGQQRLQNSTHNLRRVLPVSFEDTKIGCEEGFRRSYTDFIS